MCLRSLRMCSSNASSHVCSLAQSLLSLCPLLSLFWLCSAMRGVALQRTVSAEEREGASRSSSSNRRNEGRLTRGLTLVSALLHLCAVKSACVGISQAQIVVPFFVPRKHSLCFPPIVSAKRSPQIHPSLSRAHTLVALPSPHSLSIHQVAAVLAARRAFRKPFTRRFPAPPAAGFVIALAHAVLLTHPHATPVPFAEMFEHGLAWATVLLAWTLLKASLAATLVIYPSYKSATRFACCKLLACCLHLGRWIIHLTFLSLPSFSCWQVLQGSGESFPFRRAGHAAVLVHDCIREQRQGDGRPDPRHL
jgi:hypothetical protein